MNDSVFTSAILRPRNVTFRESGRNPVPAQSGHGTLRMKRIALSRIIGLLEVARTWWTCARALQNFPW